MTTIIRQLVALAAIIVAPGYASAQLVSSLDHAPTMAEVQQMADQQMATFQAQIPTAATVAPPCISDTGSPGTPGTLQFAPFNHTHCSKVRRERVLIPVAGVLPVTFKDAASGAPFPFTRTPVCAVTAETAAGDANVVNAQIDGSPTLAGMTIRITRTAVASLLGINVLSVPAQVATWAHFVCLEP